MFETETFGPCLVQKLKRWDHGPLGPPVATPLNNALPELVIFRITKLLISHVIWATFQMILHLLTSIIIYFFNKLQFFQYHNENHDNIAIKTIKCRNILNGTKLIYQSEGELPRLIWKLFAFLEDICYSHRQKH